MVKALQRAEQLAVLGAGRVGVDDSPANRQQVLARTGLGSKASAGAAGRAEAGPRALLLDGPAVREDVLAGLSLTGPAPAHLARQLITLDAAWKQTAARLGEAGDDARARVVPGPNGRARLVVDHLDALGEPGSLVWLRATAQPMMPRVDLPELLLEVPGDATPTSRTSGAHQGPLGERGGAAGGRGLQRRADPRDQALTAEPRPARARGPVLRAQRTMPPPAGCSSTHRHRSRSRAPGAVGYSPRPAGCGSSCPFAPSTPARRRSTSAANAASPGSTRSTTSRRHRADGGARHPA